MPHYIINNKTFKNKTAVYLHTKNLLYNHGYGVIKRGDLEFDFLQELIKLHPDYETKIGIGLKFFKLSQNRQNIKAIHMDIERLDHTYTAISWDFRKYIHKNPNTLLSRAMRNSVKNQTIRFKNNTLRKCKICNYESDILDFFHTDHIKPFSKLKIDFLKINKIKKPIDFSKDRYNLDCFKKEDYKFKKAWIKYHDTHAKYQILCKSCNIKKSNK